MLSPPITVDGLTEIERMVYSMARAREDLQIEFRRSWP
jgi:hypothetical protein